MTSHANTAKPKRHSYAKPNIVESFDAAPDSAFIAPAPLAQILDKHPMTLRRWVEAGKFPKPVKLSERSTAWRIGDVREWLRALTEGGVQ